MAASPDTRELYPLSTPGGNPIPYDVFRPYGLINVAVTDSVSAAIVIPSNVELLVLFCDISVVIRFDGAASIGISGVFNTDTFFMPASTIWTVDHNAAEDLSVIAAVPAETGTLRINCVKKWKDVQKRAISDRT